MSRRTLAAGLLLASLVGTNAVPLTGCIAGKLSPEGAAIIEGIDAALCPFTTEIPTYGGMIALACPGEEAGLAAILREVTASQPDAGPVLGSSAEVGLRRVTRAGKLVGFVPPALAKGCQAHLDGGR